MLVFMKFPQFLKDWYTSVVNALTFSDIVVYFSFLQFWCSYRIAGNFLTFMPTQMSQTNASPTE
jgi:hypothetical protein